MADLNIPDAPALPGTTHLHSGKVRDLYRIDRGEHEGRLLMVASDRISAYDHVLATPIPDKGEILTRMSLWWFDQLAEVVPSHVVSTDLEAVFPHGLDGLEWLRHRSLVCEPLEMYPVECVVRGYLAGSGWSDYQATGEVCGVALPGGLQDGSRLPEPVFTPATKADLGEHDENITFDQMSRAVGERAATRLRNISLEVYAAAEGLARERGIILADTKLEFGHRPVAGAAPVTVLADEVLTPDSSRFWPADQWEPGRPQPSYDKQIVRDWLTGPESGWDRASGEAPPPLPDAVVEKTRAKYVEVYERLTGERF